MIVYVDENGDLEFRGSINLAEKERLEAEHKKKKLAKPGEAVTEFVQADPDTVAALEAQKQAEPAPAPEAESAEEPAEEAAPPSSHDSKADWVEFAVSQGFEREEAEGMTKADLVEYFSEG